MRVLMLSDFYPPHIGGVERYVQTLSHELVEHGHHVAVATLRDGGSPSFEDDEGVPVYHLAGWNRMLAPLYTDREFRFHPPLPDAGVMAGLRRVLKLERPEIVHAHTWMLYSFAPLKAWSRAKLVVTLHNYSLVCPKTTYLHDGQVCTGASYMKCVRCASAEHGVARALLATSGLKLSSQLHRCIDRHIAVGSAVRDAVVKATGDRSIEVVPAFIPNNAVDAGCQVERPSFLPPADDYILFVGRQYAHGYKGLDVLLAAYEGLSDLAPLVAIIADYGGAPEQLPDGVTLVRNIPHDQVMAAWAHCAVGVVPSVVVEAFPLVAIEALASGKPVVASAVGGLRDVVADGESGLLVPPGDASALREALRTLLIDPARRARMGAAARERARLFTAGAIVERIEQIYADVLGQGHPVSAFRTAFQSEK